MKLDRAYSLLEIKSVDDDARVIEGIATTPEPDRVGDIVEPMGAQFKNPLPLLWQHRHDSPVGTTVFGKATKEGIPFKATLPKIEEPGALKDMVDMAWQSVKAKLVRGVSIGFRSLEHAYMDTGGIRFVSTEIMELSLVTIPANASATINSIKSLDQEQRAASGQSLDLVVRFTPPGASGSKSTPKPKPQEGSMNIAEQIKALEASRAEKAARMNSLTEKSAGEGRTKDAAEREEFDTLRDEIKALDAELIDLRALEQINLEKAAPVTNRPASAAASDSRAGVTVKTAEKLEPGIAFARYAMCLGKAKGDHHKAFRFAEQHYPQTEFVVKLLKAQADGANLNEMLRQKATVAAGSTIDATWASPLVYAETFTGDFVEFLRPRTLLGQSRFRPVPFNVRIGGQTSGGTAGWVGQGKAKPVTKADFIAYTTGYTKIAAIAVLTQELIKLSDPSAELLTRDTLADSVIERADSDLFDPDIAAVANVNPAGLLNGVDPVAGPPASGVDPDEIRCALLRLWAPWDSTNMGARPAYYTTPAVARFLASMRDALGNKAFPGTTMTGGELDGIPLRVSQYLANNGGSGGAPFILLDEAEIWLADDNSVTVDASEQASIEMSTTPSGSSVDTVAASSTNLVSMWQTNSVAFRAERGIWWGKRRTGAVQWIDGFPTSC
jgi:HK97 family phage major capsid protein/HK97 family phage prohead protease